MLTWITARLLLGGAIIATAHWVRSTKAPMIINAWYENRISTMQMFKSLF